MHGPMPRRSGVSGLISSWLPIPRRLHRRACTQSPSSEQCLAPVAGGDSGGARADERLVGARRAATREFRLGEGVPQGKRRGFWAHKRGLSAQIPSGGEIDTATSIGFICLSITASIRQFDSSLSEL